MSWVVSVSEERNPLLTSTAAARYVSPPHRARSEAISLAALLNDAWPTGGGPWRHAIAGRQRTVTLTWYKDEYSSISRASARTVPASA